MPLARGFHDHFMEQRPTYRAHFVALHIASCLRRLAMANSWNIPPWLEMEVRARDKVCVYCSSPFTSSKISKKSAASWEHIINDEKIITRENIALCCCGCNASKGQKQLSVWLQSKYCKERGITKESVAPIIKQAIADDL
jgi:5-methylcytosine-specific restriction endonuclease McrA